MLWKVAFVLICMAAYANASPIMLEVFVNERLLQTNITADINFIIFISDSNVNLFTTNILLREVSDTPIPFFVTINLQNGCNLANYTFRIPNNDTKAGIFSGDGERGNASLVKEMFFLPTASLTAEIFCIEVNKLDSVSVYGNDDNACREMGNIHVTLLSKSFSIRDVNWIIIGTCVFGIICGLLLTVLLEKCKTRKKYSNVLSK